MEYNFKSIEKKWQKKWEEGKVFEVKDNSKKKKVYVLEMFPYPSSSGLHMGHALNYSIGDVFARFKRMQGFNVLYPMGFDSLGLPAENAAIKVGEHPKPFTKNAIKNYIRQMKELGLSYDWSKTVSTMEPEYYKWNQYFFLKFLEKGLIYRKKAPVNWCNECNTVLANEQVVNGKCWRHDDTEVEIKHLEQWYMKTTDYADELLDKLPELKWPDKIKAMQKNWIGKSYGTEIDFEINQSKWPIFTTRPDTIYGVTFMVVSAQHEKLMELVTKEQEKEVKKFLKKLKSVSEKDIDILEKEGVFTGSYAVNPINNEKVPVYAGNFVVADYGSGMVMAVPAHDQRDFEFAKKYGIKIKEVVKGGEINKKSFTSEGKLINSGEFNGLDNKKAIIEITKYLVKKKLGKKTVNYKLRDWGFSRQRYWGTPIPIIVCEKCGLVPVLEKDLPVKLPEKVEFGKGNPLETNEKWLKVKCPKCNANARREADTMDTFFDSSWYYLRYCDNKNSEVAFDKKKIKYWMPVDQYIGGAEHACMHLIYARFFTKALRDLGFVNFDEPFTSLFNQGMLHGPDGEKMSKSKGNIINPDVVSKKYGMDTARFFLLSLASPDKSRDWSEEGIQGSLRLTNRIINYYEGVKIGKTSEEVNGLLNKTLKNVTEYIGDFKYRKVTIEIRSLFDKMELEKEMGKDVLEKFLQMLHVFCPHITEELWSRLGNKNFISLSKWPVVDKEKLKVKKKKVDLHSDVVGQVKNILSKVDTLKGTSGNKVYVYVMPFEVEKLDVKKIAKEIGKDVKIFSTADKKKYDPKNMSKRARPGLVGVYLE